MWQISNDSLSKWHKYLIPNPFGDYVLGFYIYFYRYIEFNTVYRNYMYHHFILLTNWRKPQNYFTLMDASRRFPSNKKIFVTSIVSSLFLYKLLTFVTRFLEFSNNKNTYEGGIQFSYITCVKALGIGRYIIGKGNCNSTSGECR